MVQVNAYKKARTLSRRSGAEATQGKVINNILAALQVVLERVELAAQLVVAEVELGLALRHTTCSIRGRGTGRPCCLLKWCNDGKYGRSSPKRPKRSARSRTHHRVAGKDVVDERSYPAGQRKVLRSNRVDRQAGLLLAHQQ